MKKTIALCAVLLTALLLCGCTYKKEQDDYASHMNNYTEQASGLESSSQDSASSMDEFVNSILGEDE